MKHFCKDSYENYTTPQKMFFPSSPQSLEEQYYCYNPNSKSLYIILNSNIPIENIGKEPINSLLSSLSKNQIESLFILLNKLNKNYAKISQMLFAIGFESVKISNVPIENYKKYKMFKMKTQFQSSTNDMEEVDF